MTRRHSFFAVLLASAAFVFAAWLAGCDRSAGKATPPAEPEEVVRVTSPHLASFTRSIAGEAVAVEMLCPPGQSPDTWRPDPETVSRFQAARLIVINGAGYEDWVQTAPLPRSRAVSTARAIDGELITMKGRAHSHGPGGVHAHEVILGHTWIDPLNAIAQAGAITDAMAAAFPEHVQAFKDNQSRLDQSLRSLHQRLSDLSQTEIPIVVQQNPLAYLARRYDWPAVRLDDDPASWPQTISGTGVAHQHVNDGPIVLVSSQPLTPAAVQELRHVHNLHIALWRTGELGEESEYQQLLESNIDRLLEAVDQASKP